MYAFKKMVAGGLMVGMLMPALAFAQTTTPTTTGVPATTQALLDRIKALQTQIAALAQQQQGLQQQQQQTVATLISTLKQGDTSGNVKILQALLAADPGIYPEGIISGYFGGFTAQAVKRFQKKHGLEQVGNVGPKTLRLLNQLFASTTSERNGDDDDDGDDDSDSHGKGKGRNKVAICHKASSTITVGAPALLAHIRHGDTLGACSGTGTTPPDTTAPVISSVVVSPIASTTATVLWSTNEAATSKVYYGTTSPVNLGTALSVVNTSLVTVHTLGLTGLTASSTVYFVVESKDASNNAATTSTASFVTAN